MKSRTLLVIFFSMFYVTVAIAQHLVEGNWATIDDETGVKRAVLHFVVTEGTLSGTVDNVYPQPGDTGICSNCPGDFKDKQVKGLQILWGLKENNPGVWEGGQILDAKTGKIYHVKMTLKDDKLYVRGYIGIPLIGRTQVWIRA